MQGEVSFIQVFRDEISRVSRGNLDYREAFHVVLIQNQHEVHVWRIEIATPSHAIEDHDFYYEIHADGYIEANPNAGAFTFDVPGATGSGGGGFGGSSSTVATQRHGNTDSGIEPNPVSLNGPKSGPNAGTNTKKSFLSINISKILEQTICPGLDVNFSACHGHFVCGTSYALISTTKEYVKLWKLQKALPESKVQAEVEFREWNTLKALKTGELLSASAAYSGRIACVYKLETESILDEADGTTRDNNVCAVTVFECESTGGELSTFSVVFILLVRIDIAYFLIQVPSGFWRTQLNYEQRMKWLLCI